MSHEPDGGEEMIPRNALMKIGLDKDIAATLVADLVSWSVFAVLRELFGFVWFVESCAFCNPGEIVSWLQST